MTDFELSCEAMIKATEAMLLMDPHRTEPHCEQRQADLYAGMDEMGVYAELKHTKEKSNG